MNNQPKTGRFEEHQIPTAAGEWLHAKLMMPRPGVRPRRVVFMSPLIGAGAAQSLLIFRNLTRRGSILFSFEYRGHPRSTGTFELDGTLVDASFALIWAWNYASGRGLPLHGFATCFGTIPLLAQFTAGGCGILLKSLSTVSGLFRLDHILRFGSFSPVLARHLGREFGVSDLLDAVAQGTVDTGDAAFLAALQEFLGGLFPELEVGPDRFEELRYDRTDLGRTILQFSRARYLDGVAVPAWLPCNFFYGRHDDLMALDLEEGRRAYRNEALSLVPHAAMHEADLDHFGRGPEHDPVIERLGDFFEAYDNRSIPAHHFRQPAGSLIVKP